MIELPGLWSLSPIGFGLGVIALVYWLLVTGRLVPKSTHLALVAAQKQRGDEWKETALAERAVKDAVLAQNGELLEGSRTMKAVVQAAGPPLDENTRPGGA